MSKGLPWKAWIEVLDSRNLLEIVMFILLYPEVRDRTGSIQIGGNRESITFHNFLPKS